jgi:hypothetical protein
MMRPRVKRAGVAFRSAAGPEHLLLRHLVARADLEGQQGAALGRLRGPDCPGKDRRSSSENRTSWGMRGFVDSRLA